MFLGFEYMLQNLTFDAILLLHIYKACNIYFTI